MKKIIIFVLSAMFLASVFIATATPIAQAALTQSQVDAIIALLQSFGADQTTIDNVSVALGGGAPPSWCHDFNVNLKIGDTGVEVDALHSALTRDGFTVNEDEKSTDSFGESTASAVSGFQEKYKDEILTPLGLEHGTGYAGPATRAKLNQLYGCGIIPPITQPSITVVSPNGGEQWQVGSTQIITWSTANISIPSGTTVNVNVDLIWPGQFGTSSMLIGQLLPNTGQYQLIIPSAVAPRNDYKIQTRLLHLLPSGAINTLASDQSNATLSIVSSTTTQLQSVFISKSGTGSGTVNGTGGKTCPAPSNQCTFPYNPGETVTLTAVPSSSSTFAGWSGDCSGTGNCVLTMNTHKTVTAVFNTTTTATVTGTITASPNPCSIPSGATTCSTTINWTTTGGVTNSVVTVTLSPGGSESVFEYSGASGSKVALIAGSPYTYLFKLYQLNNTTPLSQVTVTGTASAASALPDLVVSSISHSPASPSVGSAMSFTGIVRNSGAGAAGASQAGLYIDINNNDSLDVNNIPFQPTGSLAANATETETWPNAWTAVAGTHKYMICADVTAVVTEVAGDVTNCASAVFTVGDAGTGGTTATLTVSKTGTGTGLITGPGIHCGSNCSEVYASGATVALSATPSTSSVFAGWSGACSGAGETCALIMNSDKSTAAIFNAGGTPTGSITVTSPNGGESLQRGSTYVIGWQSQSPPANTHVKLHLLDAANNMIRNLSGSAVLSPTGFFSWIIPADIPFASYKIEASLRDAAGAVVVRDQSDSTFNIVSQITGSITASPNPCSIPSGATTCSTTINWTTTGGVTNSVVTVTLSPGGSESVFEYSGASGSKVALIAGSPYTYLFKLYQLNNTTPLSQVTVTGTASAASANISQTANILKSVPETLSQMLKFLRNQ